MSRSLPDPTALVADNNVRYMALQALAVLTQINIQVPALPTYVQYPTVLQSMCFTSRIGVMNQFIWVPGTVPVPTYTSGTGTYIKCFGSGTYVGS